MEIIHLNTKANQPIAVALGYFDGLHLGHQAVIADVVRYAKANNMTSAVMTFSTNPKLFLNKLPTTKLLTPQSEKIHLLKQLSVDQLMILPFDEEMAHMSATAFIANYLIQQNVGYVAVGFDFRFGHQGAGDIHLLQEYQEFKLSVVPRQNVAEIKIGTTGIRKYLEVGEVAKVAAMLGRSYSLTGTVIKGNQRGRTIGFPTANLRLDEEYVIPKKGVYAVNVYVLGQLYMGVCNIGHNPTFNFTEVPTIEVYVLDFDEMIYGEVVRLEFLAFLRMEQKFSGAIALKKQLQLDVKATQDIFLRS